MYRSHCASTRVPTNWQLAFFADNSQGVCTKVVRSVSIRFFCLASCPEAKENSDTMVQRRSNIRMAFVYIEHLPALAFHFLCVKMYSPAGTVLSGSFDKDKGFGWKCCVKVRQVTGERRGTKY